MPLDCEESVGHSCGCPFGLSSETGLLVTTSFSGSDRMDNVLKDHRWPSLPLAPPHGGCPILTLCFSTLEPALSGVEGVGSTGHDEGKGPSPSLALVKLDFLIGTKWGSNARRKQKCPSRSP